MYRPGELDQRIEFFTRTESDDGYGGRTVCLCFQRGLVGAKLSRCQAKK